MSLRLTVTAGNVSLLGGADSMVFGPAGGTIGRGPENDWTLPDPERFISTRHVRIELVEGEYRAVDVSTNGTYLNDGDEPIGNGGSVVLQPGDQLHIGEFSLTAAFEATTSDFAAAPGADMSAPMAPQGGQPDPLAAQPDPFGGQPDPLAAQPDPFGGQPDPLAAPPAADPFGAPGGDAFGAPVDDGLPDPMADPLAGPPAGGTSDWGTQPPAQDMPGAPFDPGATLDPLAMMDAAAASGGIPGPIDDPFGAAAGNEFLADEQARPDPGPPLMEQPVAPTSESFVPPDLSQDPLAAPPPAAPSEPAGGGIPALPDDWDKTSFNPAPASLEPTPPPAPPAPPPQAAPPQPPAADPAAASGAWPQPGSQEPPGADPLGSGPLGMGGTAGGLPTPGGAGLGAPGGGTGMRRPGGGSTESLKDMLVAAGVDPAAADSIASDALAEEMGLVLRTMISGMLDVLKARAEIKSQFRVPVTMMQAVENNPLKFCANPDDALFSLFVKRDAGYMGPADSFSEGIADLKAHQMAMMAGMRAAFDSLIERFDPNNLQERFDSELRRGAMFKSLNKTKYWEMLVEMHQDIHRDEDEAFQRLFGDVFAKAYEEQMARLAAARRR